MRSLLMNLAVAFVLLLALQFDTTAGWIVAGGVCNVLGFIEGRAR